MPPSAQSQQVARLFDSVAPTYDQVGVPWFTPVAEGLVDAVAPAAGERLLDLGCGRGAVVLAARRRLGPTGRVTALDLAPGMVEALRADLAASPDDAAAPVDVVLGDAAHPEAPGGLDVVTASLVLFFLPEPVAALAEWRELLRPGGRLGVSTFGPRTPAWTEVDDVFVPHLPPEMLDARTTGASGAFATDAGVEGLLREGGLVDVRTEHLDLVVELADVAAWTRWSRSHGQRGMWDQVPPDRLAEVEAAVAAALDATREDGVITLRQPIRYTLGRRPD